MAFYSKLAAVYSLIFPFREPVHQFLKKRLPPGRTFVLDVGCGTGHYTARFAHEGYSVLGIDLDGEMIRVARQRHAGGSFRVLNMLDIDGLEGSFDLIFCIGNTVAHLPRKDFETFVHRVYRKLGRDGLWIFQVRNWDYVLKLESYDFPVLEADDGIRFHRRYFDITPDRLLFETRLTAGRRPLFEERVSLYPIRTEHYVEIHEKCGFHLQEHFADFAGTRYVASKDSANVFVFAKY